MTTALPRALSFDADTGSGSAVTGDLAEDADRWGSRTRLLTRQRTMAPAAGPLETDWGHPEIGWGVVLPERDDVPAADRAVGADAPEQIRRLLAARGGPVLRYRPDLGVERLARYFPDGRRQDPEIGLSDFGTGEGRLPLYLLLVGDPVALPWRLQYSLNRRHHVGRLDLDEPGLDHYVTALLDDWGGASTRAGEAVVWSVNADSMTATMEATIADRIAVGLRSDAEIRTTRLSGHQAVHGALGDALVSSRPALVVTSSHGRTGPLGLADEMRADLGKPVDLEHRVLDPDALLAAWQPAGAVWFAQACCSAGCETGTAYDGLLAEGSEADLVTRGVGGLGARTAPLPRALLAAEAPLRAFIGHVEPTFDWTLVKTDTGQWLTGPLVSAFYPALYSRRPVSLALAEQYRGVGELYAKWARAQAAVDALEPGARTAATYYRLTATDRESLVLLGDPTAMLPPLPSQT